MKTKNNYRSVVLIAGAAVFAAAGVSASQQKKEDSAYRWGRWAVLSPAAGGTEPYVAAATPGSDFNPRPCDSEGFCAGAAVTEAPEVVETCAAGSACGIATYSRTEGAGGKSGPVLADFALTTGQITDPNLGNPPGSPIDTTAFTVSGSDDPSTYPDVQSAPILATYSGGTGTIQRTVSTVESFDPVTLDQTTSLDTSTLSHDNQDTSQSVDFNGVDSGYWQQLAEQQVANIITNQGTTTTLSDADGYFVYGMTPTIEQMETFAAGHASAVYNGLVLDYASPVALTFDFNSSTFAGDFTTANGFNGFQIDGAVSGVNFSASDAGKTVNGSFFNGGFNASGAVNNGTQTGVFSADLAN
jgi:hypothetical protein